MTHKRGTIVSAIVQQIEDSSIVGTGLVFSTRLDPVDISADLPCINVTASEETSEPQDMSSDLKLRELQVAIEIVVAETDISGIDDLAEEVESAMDESLQIGGAISHEYRGFSFTESNEGERAVGRLTLKYTVIYSF